MPFQAGFDKPVNWTPDSGGNATALNILGWDAEDSADTPEVTHTGTNGEQAFLAGIKRSSCTISLNYNSSASPKSIGITAGAKGTFSFSTGGTPHSLHVIIEKVPYKSTVNGVVTLTIQAKSDALKADGTITSSVAFA